jgi:hypothetical protein
MLLWIPVNRAMFTGNDTTPPADELANYAEAAAVAFLVAHRAATAAQRGANTVDRDTTQHRSVKS